MKTYSKIVILFVALLLLVPTAEAQRKRHKSSRQFDFELRGGVNFCQIDGDGSAHYNKLGFHGAVNTSYPISDDGTWRLLFEIGVSQKGSHIVNSSVNRVIALTYVEVPLMLTFNAVNNQLRIGMGVAPSILAASKVTTDGVHDADHSQNYKRMDPLPFCAGVRYRFNDHLGADVRYYASMLNVAKDNSVGTYFLVRSNKGQFNRLITAGLTLSF